MNKYFLSLAVLFLLIACNGNKTKEPIESDVIVSFLKENDQVVIEAETEKIYGCFNYQLNYVKNSAEKTITVNFSDITIPEVCMRALGPARATINLGELEKETYIVNFFMNRSSTTMQLIVGDTLSTEVLDQGNVRLK